MSLIGASHPRSIALEGTEGLDEAADNAIPRRSMLRLSALFAANALADAVILSPAGCVRPDHPTTPVIGTAATGIDVHCHVFNARDLPIPGFVLHVALENDPAANVQLGALVTFISLLLDHSAESADQEVASLGSHHPQMAALPAGQREAARSAALRNAAYAAALAMQDDRPPQRQRTTITQVRTVLPRAEALLASPLSGNITGAASGTAGGTEAARSDRVRFLATMAQMKYGGPVPGLSPPRNGGATQVVAPPAPSDTVIASLSRSTAQAVSTSVADGVVESARNQSGVFYLASLVTRPRAEMVEELIDLPAARDRGAIALLTPAMVDFTYWLADNAGETDPRKDPDPTRDPGGITPLPDQIAVMSVIAARKTDLAGNPRPYAVHPFVSFCPWREIAQRQAGSLAPEQRQFNLVRDAILSKGFIGIKMYPLMGFRPIGNAAEPASLYPARLQRLTDFRAKLDEVLDEVYTWCVANEVPIMAHCSFSQYSSVAGGRLGSPQGWWDVLRTHPTLRLNLAHAGGVWNLSAARAPAITKAAGSLWPIDIISKLGPSHPNLYADLADFGDVLGCAQPVPDPASAVGGLARLVAANPASRRHVMYGTDYMFLIQTAGTENYLAQMRDCLAPALGISQSDLMGCNAARFLGLNDPASGTRVRLDAFRGDSFLSRWNGV